MAIRNRQVIISSDNVGNFVTKYNDLADTLAEITNRITGGTGTDAMMTNASFANSAGGTNAFVVGSSNVGSGTNAFVAGTSNTASGTLAAVVGGQSNIASGTRTVIVGGNGNTCLGSGSVIIAASSSNLITATGFENNNIIAGGFTNLITNNATQYSGIFAGFGNAVNGANYAAIIAGNNNFILSGSSDNVIAGGEFNTINVGVNDTIILAGNQITAARSNTAYARRICAYNGALEYQSTASAATYAGTAVLSSGSVNVTGTGFSAGTSMVMLTTQSPSGTVGAPYISASSNGAFTISSTSGSDNSTVAWMIVDKR